MALTEQLNLDISAAQRQIDRLEGQISDLGRPVSVPVDIDTASFDRIAQSLGVSEEEARRLAGSVGQSINQASALDEELRNIARGLGLSESEASDFARQMRNAETSARDTGEEIETTGRRGISTFRRLATVVGGIATALGVRGLFGAIFGAGLDRFSTIEDATRALSIQLGDAAQSAALLEEVLQVVSGTPFNLDQFAAAAQQLVGFGVEVERIPGILTAVGEAAATQGARAPEFVDRLVTVFGQITTTGRVALEDINRIADTGVNALVILANAFGVTTEEMRAMISEGAVPAAEAIDVLTEGIVQGTEGVAGATVALGGTMEGLRETLSGARGGLRAALARLGESFFNIVGGGAVEGLNELAAAVDLVTASVSTLNEVDAAAVGGFIAGLPSAFETIVQQGSAAGEAVGNALQVIGSFVRLDFGDVGTQFSQLGDDIQSFREGGVENQAIQTLIDTLASGVDPATALQSTLIDLGQSVSTLTVESFEVLAGQLGAMADAAGASGTDLSALADGIETFGQDAGFSAAGVEILVTLLRELATQEFLGQQLDRDISRFQRLGRAAFDAAAPIERNADAAAAFRQQVDQIRLDQLNAELEEAADNFDQLPTALDGAAAALRDSEGEIEDDFTDFLARLQEQLAAQRDFSANLDILSDLGFEDLRQTFEDAGLDAAELLADAVANPEEARRAEEELDAFAEEQARSFRQSFIDELQETIDLTIPTNIALSIQSLTAQGFSTAEAQAAVGDVVESQVGGVAGPGAQVNIEQNFNGFTPSTPDLTRAAQAINALVN